MICLSLVLSADVATPELHCSHMQPWFNHSPGLNVASRPASTQVDWGKWTGEARLRSACDGDLCTVCSKSTSTAAARLLVLWLYTRPAEQDIDVLQDFNRLFLDKATSLGM